MMCGRGICSRWIQQASYEYKYGTTWGWLHQTKCWSYMRPQIRSKEQLKCIYSEYLVGRCKIRILECEAWCNIITHDNLLYTLWEIHIPKNAFGLRMKQDVFQRKIDQMCENCRDAIGIADDVQAFGNEKTLDRNFHEAIECIRKGVIKHNFDTCFIKTKCCIFFLVICTLQKESNLTWRR